MVFQLCLPLPRDRRWTTPGTEASRVFLFQIPEVQASFQELLRLTPPSWTSSLWPTFSSLEMGVWEAQPVVSFGSALPPLSGGQLVPLFP